MPLVMLCTSSDKETMHLKRVVSALLDGCSSTKISASAQAEFLSFAARFIHEENAVSGTDAQLHCLSASLFDAHVNEHELEKSQVVQFHTLDRFALGD